MRAVLRDLRHETYPHRINGYPSSQEATFLPSLPPSLKWLRDPRIMGETNNLLAVRGGGPVAFVGLEPTRLTTVVEMEMEEGGIREDRAEGLVPVEGQQGYCLLQVPALEARRVALQARLRHCLPVQFEHPDKVGTVHLGLPLFCESSMCSESRPCPKDHRRVSSR